MNKYEFKAIYSGAGNTFTITVEANTKWGAWAKALYAAMEKEDEGYILVGLAYSSIYKEVNIK